jgi:hypothetical protein
MALNTTTLSSAVGLTDTTIVVASATGAAPGVLALVDGEVMTIGQAYSTGTTLPVLRGRNGSATSTHASGANVNLQLASDPAGQAAGTATQWPTVGRARPVVSYGASGAVALPLPGSDLVAVLNGTSGLTMTLASPTKDMDGCVLYLVANGKAAHTVTITAGLGGGGGTSDVGTFSASYAGGCQLMALNGAWTMVGSGLFTATGAVGAPLWA